jgi:hypothetical protein
VYPQIKRALNNVIPTPHPSTNAATNRLCFWVSLGTAPRNPYNKSYLNIELTASWELYPASSMCLLTNTSGPACSQDARPNTVSSLPVKLRHSRDTLPAFLECVHTQECVNATRKEAHVCAMMMQGVFCRNVGVFGTEINFLSRENTRCSQSSVRVFF